MKNARRTETETETKTDDTGTNTDEVQESTQQNDETKPQ